MTAFARDVQMVVINGHRMVSLRTFGETFGATIDYDNNRDGVCISLDYQNVNLVPYSRIAWINDRRVALDSPMVIIDDVTYVPIDFLCDAFDFSSNWLDADQFQIVIRSRPAFRIILVRDIDWGRRQHQWRYSYNARDYANMHYGTDRNNNTHDDRNNGGHDRDNNSDRDQRPNNDWRQGKNSLPPRVDNGSRPPIKPRQNIDPRPKDTPRQYNGTRPQDTPRQYNGTRQQDTPRQYNNTRPQGTPRQYNGTLQQDTPRQYNDTRPQDTPRQYNGTRPQDTPRQYNDTRSQDASRQYNNSTPARRPGTTQERDTTNVPARKDSRYQSGNTTPQEKQSVTDRKNSKAKLDAKSQKSDKNTKNDREERKDK